MIEWGRGVKAGAASGAISGILLGILITILTSLLASPVLTADTLYIVAVGSIFVGAVRGTISGVIMGILFAIFFNKIPLKTSVQKGITFTLVYTILLTYLAELLSPGILVSRASEMWGMRVWGLLLILILIEGALLGYFWDKFYHMTHPHVIRTATKKQKLKKRKTAPRKRR